jgi:hypothetical protein
MHLARRVIPNASQPRIDVFADLGYLSAEFVPDYDGPIPRNIAAVIGEHFVPHPGTRCDLVDALIGPADRRDLNADLYVGVSHPRFWFVLHELQTVLGETELFECLHSFS